MKRHDRSEAEPRVSDVVAIANIAHTAVLKRAESVDNSERIGGNLAWVVVVGEAIDDGGEAVLSKVEQSAVLEHPGHDDVIVPAEHASDVAGFFTLAKLDVIRA
jgi:hypothetical protein